MIFLKIRCTLLLVYFLLEAQRPEVTKQTSQLPRPFIKWVFFIIYIFGFYFGFHGPRKKIRCEKRHFLYTNHIRQHPVIHSLFSKEWYPAVQLSTNLTCCSPPSPLCKICVCSSVLFGHNQGLMIIYYDLPLQHLTGHLLCGLSPLACDIYSIRLLIFMWMLQTT